MRDVTRPADFQTEGREQLQVYILFAGPPALFGPLPSVDQEAHRGIASGPARESASCCCPRLFLFQGLVTKAVFADSAAAKHEEPTQLLEAVKQSPDV